MKPEENGKDNDDCAFLEKVLNSLYDIGGGTVKKKKKKRQETCEQEVGPEDAPADGNEDRGDGGEKTVQSPGSVAPKVEVVNYYDPAKRPKKPKQIPVVNQTLMLKKEAGTSQEGLSLEKARLEVHRFGITGYKKEQQRVFEEERAIMLGARPPKKKYVNYKALQEQIQDKKMKAKEEQKTGLKRKKTQPRDKKSKSSGSSSAPTGQVGRFKGGMLVLSPKEIQTIKAKMGRK
ncbi:40S small subunit processome assembly factor 1 isoform X2 [Stigmatopora argus]